MAEKTTPLILKTFIFIFLAAIISIAHYAFLFFTISLLPTLVAYLIDKRPAKTATNAIGAFNFIGILPHLFSLIKGNNYDAKFQELISDPYIWFIIYGSAAIGWIMIWLIPEIFGAIYLARAERKITKMRKMQTEIIEEWGDEVKLGKLID